MDPVHAMLMDMILSLGTVKAKTINPTIDEKKSDVEPHAEPEEQPTKKKKVSYKSLASKLLED